ncbi:MAG: glycosyltransferase family 39 protein, partial [Leptolyngbyaceae bacterium]|nr:glycosyltransferase family 39 protein [Leptolyngbyaceae bacterium]
SVGLIDETEPLFAEAARQMTVTGDWITPYFNGETRFDKPPLIYWLMAIAYQIIGVNPWAARLPSALAAIALTAAGFYLLYRFSGGNVRKQPWANGLVAVIGSGAIALNIQTIVWARSGVSDMLLSACMGIALFSFFAGYVQPPQSEQQRLGYLGFYVFSALAVLTKGPVGLVIPGSIVVAFLAYVGQLAVIRQEMRPLWGSVIFAAMILPWYMLVTLVNGRAFIDNFFGYHNVERFTSVVNNHSAPWYFYFLVVVVGFIPWSVYLPMAIAHTQFWRRRYWQGQPRQTHLGLFAMTWFLVIFSFFTIAITKLPSYTLPLLPAASVLVALLWQQQNVRPERSPGMMVSHGANLLFLGILAWAVFNSGQWLGDDPVMPELPRLVQEAQILIMGGMVWSLGAIATAILIAIRRTRWIWASNLIAFVTFFLLTVIPALPLMDSQRQLPLRQIASEIVETADPSAEIIMVGFKKPTLVFYTQRSVTYIYGVDEAIAHLRNQGTLRNVEAKHPASSQDAFIVGTVTELATLSLPPQKYEVVTEMGVYQLLRLQLQKNR